jgi:hypothetical protein
MTGCTSVGVDLGRGSIEMGAADGVRISGLRPKQLLTRARSQFGLA